MSHRSVKWEGGGGTFGSFPDLELPARFSDIPDIFINLYAHHKRRISNKKYAIWREEMLQLIISRIRFAYLRLSAKYVRQCMRYPRWLLLDTAASSLFSFYEIPGNILLSLSLTTAEDHASTVESSSHPLNTLFPMHSSSNDFILRCYILQGRNRKRCYCCCE